MPFVATNIKLSHKVKMILKGIARSQTLPLNQVQRSKIIISASKGRSNQQIAIDLSLSPNAVSKWRMRWAKNVEFIEAVEQKTFKELEKAVKALLKDSPRSGHPCDFTEVQILKILEIACRNPSEFGYETSHWSLPQLAKVVIKLGIVDSISPASVGRFLKYGKHPPSQDKILVTFNR
jgi:antitoxin component of RelBE/YafQ-DinJ toxin-antitoxin module